MTDGEWLVTYVRKDQEEEELVCMPTLAKLFRWIRRNASRCREVRIIMREEVV